MYDDNKAFLNQPLPLLTVAADYVPGTFVVTGDDVQLSEEGWDALRLQVWGVFPGVGSPGALLGDVVPDLGATLAAVQSLFDVGGYLGSAASRWFYTGAGNFRCDGPDIFEGELYFKGCADMARPFKLSIDSGSAQWDGKNATISDGFTTYGPKPRLRANVPELTMTCAYPVFNAAPATQTVGQPVTSMPQLLSNVPAIAPPYEPAIRSWFATMEVEDDLIWQWPNGWWKERSQIECLPGVSPAVAHFVTDSWRYSFERLPGS